MELQTPTRFLATVLCWTQDSEVLKIEVSRSFAHNNPYLDFLQGANSAIEYPHMGFDNYDNNRAEVRKQAFFCHFLRPGIQRG